MTGQLLEDMTPGTFCRVLLEDGSEGRVIVPCLGLDIKSPAGGKGRHVALEYDGAEDAFWATRFLPEEDQS